MRFRQAFTLIELLIVVGILAILAGILFPVFTSALGAARQAACLSHFAQVSKAVTGYMDDYNTVFPPANYHGYSPGMVDASDRTWVQAVFPYAKSIDVFHCPADYGRGAEPGVRPSDDMDATPDSDWGQAYIQSLRTDLGYNYSYLSPVGQVAFGQFMARPTRLISVQQPTMTLVFIDSVWAVDQTGKPYGGGQWLVAPPCRYDYSDMTTDTDTFPVKEFVDFYDRVAPHGWDMKPGSGTQYGGSWPWHDGRFTVAFVDGHVKSLDLGAVTAGCDPKRDYNGLIRDRTKYLWSLSH